jgi:hypothetical protein
VRLPAKIEPWLTPAGMLQWVYEARAAPGLLQKRLAVWLTFAGPFYAAAAVSPLDGRLCSLVLPGMTAETMGVCLRHTAKTFAPDRCILFLDQAGWHVAEGGMTESCG